MEDPRKSDPVRYQGEARNGYSLYFASFNRNKRSITLDLRSEEGKVSCATDGMTSRLPLLATNFFATSQQRLRTGNDHALAAPYGLFDAVDAQIAVAPSIFWRA